MLQTDPLFEDPRALPWSKDGLHLSFAGISFMQLEIQLTDLSVILKVMFQKLRVNVVLKNKHTTI